MHKKFEELDNLLINHYECFKTGQFWLETFTDEYIHVNTFSYTTASPRLYVWIGNFIKKWALKNKIPVRFVFVDSLCWDMTKVTSAT